CLTGRMMDAEEAERSGLVSRLVAHDSLIEEAEAVAATIASKSLIASGMVKQAVDAAFETTLQQRLTFERWSFRACLSTDDQSEGMAAYIEKRKPYLTVSRSLRQTCGPRDDIAGPAELCACAGTRTVRAFD